MRKVIQIAASESLEGNLHQSLYALCDDGTMWKCNPRIDEDTHWFQLDNVPQPNLTEKK